MANIKIPVFVFQLRKSSKTKDDLSDLWTVPICFRDANEAEAYVREAIKDADYKTFKVKKCALYDPKSGTITPVKEKSEVKKVEKKEDLEASEQSPVPSRPEPHEGC